MRRLLPILLLLAAGTAAAATGDYSAAARFVFQLAPEFTPEDVEEVCQEAFLSVIRNLPAFDGRSRLQTWVFRIATNKAHDFRDRQNAAKRGGGHRPQSLQAEDAETGVVIDPASPAPGPDAGTMRTEEATLLRAALDRLGDPCREIIELRYFGDLSYEDISNLLRLNIKTVSSRLSKCLDRLEALAREVFSEPGRETTSPNQNLPPKLHDLIVPESWIGPPLPDQEEEEDKKFSTEPDDAWVETELRNNRLPSS